MSSFTFSSAADLWPVGTAVGVFLPSGQRETPTRGPSVASGTVQPDGSLSFSGLAVGRYVASDGTRARAFRVETAPSSAVAAAGVFDIQGYAFTVGDADASEACRAAVSAAVAYIAQTGKGAHVVLPPGALPWNTRAATVPVYHTVAEGLGVPIPPGLTGHLKISGAGEGLTTIVLSDTGCRNAFYADTTGANIHATTVNGSSSITITSVPEGAVVVGQVLVGPGIPPSTVIASYNAGTGAATLGQALAPGTPVTATADGTNVALVGYGLDTFQNLTFEDFGIDNNGATGRCDTLFGNRAGNNRTEYYKSFRNITARRLFSYGYSFDATEATTYKGFLGLIGQHAPGDVYSTTPLTSSTDIRCEDITLRDVQNGLVVASFVGPTFGAQKHWYDNIVYQRCRVDHTYSNPTPATTLHQTSLYICGSGWGDTCKILDCTSKGSGDDGIELGAMQRIFVDRFACKDHWFEGIMFRHSQDPPDLRSQEITVTNTLIEATATLAATAGTPWARPFRFDVDNSGGLGNATGFGRFRFDRVTYKLANFALSDLTGRTSENDLGFNIYGPIQSVEMNGCKVVVENFNYDSAVNVDLACLVANTTPPLLDTTVNGTTTMVHSPASFKVRNFEAIVTGGGATGAGSFLLAGLWPIGNGIFEVDGMEMQIDTLSSNLVPATIAQVGKGGNYSVLRLRGLRGIRGGTGFGTGSTTFYPIRVWNSGTWGTAAGVALFEVDGCDFTGWGNQATDIDLTNAPSSFGQFMRLGKRNKWSVTAAVPAGGRIQSAASFTMQSTHDVVGITDTSAIRTVTLPNEQKTPWGQMIVITDESGAAGTNNITVQRAGGDTFADGTTSKAISTNGGSLRLMALGTSNKWAVV